MKAAVGGSFNVLHLGHRTLIDKAFEVGEEVAVGIMSDTFVKAQKKTSIPLEKRLAALMEYLSSKDKKYSINVIENAQGNLLTDEELEILVVSPETFTEAEQLSKTRVAKGMNPLRIVKIGYVLADDCTPISSTRIIEGEMDETGRLLRPMRLGIGSDNPVKVQAVRNVMSRIYGEVQIRPLRVNISVPNEPWGDEVEHGAIERARKSIGTNDYGVGIEAGIFEHRGDLYDIQFCAVVDKMGRVTIGHGSGFKSPPRVAESLRKGSSVGQAFQELYGQDRSGRSEGAIGYLTYGMLNRVELTEHAVIAAMVPRIRKELYFES